MSQRKVKYESSPILERRVLAETCRMNLKNAKYHRDPINRPSMAFAAKQVNSKIRADSEPFNAVLLLVN